MIITYIIFELNYLLFQKQGSVNKSDTLVCNPETPVIVFFSSLFLHFNENVEITDVDFVLFNKSWPRAKRSSGSNSFCQLQIARSSRVLPYSNTFFLGPFACLLNLRRSVYNTVTVTTCPIQLNNRAPR